MAVAQEEKAKTRLELLVDAEAKETIEQTASACGKTIDEFAVSTLLRSAQEVLDDRQTIQMSNRDFTAFLDAVEADCEPGPELKQGAERFKQRHGY